MSLRTRLNQSVEQFNTREHNTMEAPQITLKYANDQASEISILLFLCMITEQFGFAYEIVSVSEESNNDIVIFQAYWPRKLSGQQLRFKMTDDNEQVAQMLLCDDDSAGKRSTRAKDASTFSFEYVLSSMRAQRRCS